MDLKLYNTLTRAKEVFRPLDELAGRPPADWRVRMYVCGPTVYDRAHIGNARPVIVFDVLFRLLRHIYGEKNVIYVRNITDVDDKINARAAERGVPIRELTGETYKWFKEDVGALGCLEPTFEPRATEFVQRTDGKLDMITLIARLIEQKNAYVAEGHALFDVGSMPDYGKLAHRSLDDMIAGARVEVAPYKRNPMDFVLWKPSKEGEPAWDSPWGRGRPGWHIECSAMSAALLGETFDIHGGGIDLVFPHHENELAQSRCAFHAPLMAQFWMHNGFVQMEGEKMAKSEGNVVTINDLRTTEKFGGQKWPGAVLKYAMLATHYRQPLDWTSVRLLWAQEQLHSFWRVTRKVEINASPDARLVEALHDDLNTPQAIVELSRLSGDVNRDPLNMQAAAKLKSSCHFLGIDLDELDTRRGVSDSDRSLIETRIALRNVARGRKNFQEADRIRDELAKMGVVLHDNKNGTTTWEVAR